MKSELAHSLSFVFAGLLLGIVSFMAFPVAAKQKKQNPQSTKENRAFLAEKKSALAYYNVLSHVYDLLNPFLYTASMRDEVLRFIKPDMPQRVLDVGCGTGYTTAGVLEFCHVIDTIGVDQNRIQLTRAARNLRFKKSRISLCRADVENLPFRNESFNAVVSAGAVEYFPDPGKAIKEMDRVLRHQGKLVVAGPEFAWFRRFSLHKIFYTPASEELCRLFRRVNMHDVQTELTGLHTLFGTDKYVLIVKGTK